MNSRTLSRRTSITIATLAAVSAFAAGCASTGVEHVPPTRMGAPYSRAVRVGHTLYLAGDGAQHADPTQEAHLLMQSVQSTLALEGMSLDDLVYVTVYCTDLSLYETFNDVYVTYFEDESRLPARVFVGASDLPLDLRFEMTGIAVAR